MRSIFFYIYLYLQIEICQKIQSDNGGKYNQFKCLCPHLIRYTQKEI